MLAIDYLKTTVERYPDKTAIVDSGASVSFLQVWNRALHLARWISVRFPDRGLPVAIDLPKSIDAIIALVAVQLSGNIYAPLDPESPPGRKREIFKSLGEFLWLREEAGRITLNDEVYDEAPVQSENLAGLEQALLERLAHGADACPLYIMHTSGTTGRPKGVAISNASVIDYIEWAIETYAVSEAETIGSQAPLCFDNSTLDLYLCFFTGATLHLIPRDTLAFPPLLGEYLESIRINFIFWTPSLISNMLALKIWRSGEVPGLKKILFAGEAMPLSVLRQLRELFPDALLSNLYGPTEATVDTTYWIFGDELESLEATPIGKPCRNHRILLLDDAGHLIERADTPGEICIAGAGVALGYWNEPELTRQAFIANPEPGRCDEIIYKTGDMGYVSGKDALIYLTGRNDGQFKHQGHRIESGEIENALNALEGIAQSCVFYDADSKAIIACYMAVKGYEGPPQRADFKDRLPTYMFPRRFIKVETFPQTVNGKLDRKALREQYNQGRYE